MYISVNINENIIHEYILHTPTLHQKKLGADTGCPNWAPEQHSKSLPSHPAWL